MTPGRPTRSGSTARSDDDGIVPLSVGENAISVLVTAEDGETTRTYTVTVTRAEAPPEPPALPRRRAQRT